MCCSPVWALARLLAAAGPSLGSFAYPRARNRYPSALAHQRGMSPTNTRGRRPVAPFGVDIGKQESCILVTVTGELDISTAPQLEQALAENATQSDMPLV